MTDFCYGRPMLNHVVRQAAVMDRMMAEMGVEPAIAARVDHGTAFYEARTRCIECRALAQCRSWLEATKPDETPPPFCPNTGFFATCLDKGAGEREAPAETRPQDTAPAFPQTCPL